MLETMTPALNLKPILWTLEQALRLIQNLQPKLHKLQYHVALGGGVLNNGSSRKDLDLYFLPFSVNQDDPSPSAEAVLLLLEEYLGVHDPIVTHDPSYLPQHTIFQYREKFVEQTPARIDVFIA